MKFWRYSFYILSITPWLFVIPLLTFFFHAWNILGYPPGYNQPDPKELSIYSVYEPFISFGFICFTFALFVCTAYIPTYLIINRRQIVWSMVITCAASYLVGLVVAFSELLEWWLD